MHLGSVLAVVPGRDLARSDAEFCAFIGPLGGAYLTTVLIGMIYVAIHPLGDEMASDFLQSASDPMVLTANVVALFVSLPVFVLFVVRIGGSKSSSRSLPSMCSLCAISCHHVPQIIVFCTTLWYESHMYSEVRPLAVRRSILVLT
jgi:hypothetical protein